MNDDSEPNSLDTAHPATRLALIKREALEWAHAYASKTFDDFGGAVCEEYHMDLSDNEAAIFMAEYQTALRAAVLESAGDDHAAYSEALDRCTERYTDAVAMLAKVKDALDKLMMRKRRTSVGKSADALLTTAVCNQLAQILWLLQSR